jgi:hypothetical protein
MSGKVIVAVALANLAVLGGAVSAVADGDQSSVCERAVRTAPAPYASAVTVSGLTDGAIASMGLADICE